jgi:glycosyltransferase involved in cell wall biosynthesis
MNVLHVIGSLDQRAGGPLRVVLDLSAASVRLGVRSEVLGFGSLQIPDNPLPHELIHSLPVVWRKYGWAPRLRSWCARNIARFDVVILHGMWTHANRTVSRECRAAGVPYIYFPHGMLDLWSVNGQGLWKRIKKTAYWYWRERGVMAGSKAAFFTTQRELQNAKKTFALPAMHPLVVIPYGMAPMCADVEDSPREDIRQSPETKVALFLGRVHRKKRPDLLIRGWREAAVPSKWRLIIAGPGEPEYLGELARLAVQCGVSRSVQFTGPVTGADKRYLLCRAAWFLLPSEQENFGVAVLEAITSGCAVAVSDQVYLADEFPDGSEVLPLDGDAWTRFLGQRMVDDAWREDTARQTREKLLPVYNLQSVTCGWVDAIRRVVDGHPAEDC